MTGFAERVTAELACPGCPAEVRVTFGAEVYARVIHAAACPWLPRYQDGGLSQRDGDHAGAIPCGVRAVTHRGPCKRDPGQAERTGPASSLQVVPRGPRRGPKPCNVPGCGKDARLYPAGWRCDEHRPGRQPGTTRSAS